MNSSKKILLSTIGIAILLVLVTGVTFAFFNYTRTGIANNFKVGRIYFNTSQNGNINLSNVFPITSDDLENDTDNHDSVTINITGDTTYSGGIEYLVTLDQVNNRINSKRIPILFNTEVSGVGTSSDDYYTERGSSESIYILKEDGIIKNEKYLLVGYIASGATGINGSITITAYIDKDKILISDTYDRQETDNMGTPNSMAEGKIVFTTEEWNNFQNNDSLSFKIKVEANEGVWVRNPSDDTPGKCFTCNLSTVYGYNTNRTQTDINDCVDYFTDEGWSVDINNGETLSSFCDGTGTMWGETIQEYIENDWFGNRVSNYLVEHNIINELSHSASIKDYDVSCGRDVVIPETIDIPQESYTYNDQMTSNEIEDCVNFFYSELEYNVDTSNNETMEAFCAGTGTCYGEYLSDMIRNNYFGDYEMNRLKELHVANATVRTVNANVKSIDSQAFKNADINSIVLPEGLENIGKEAFRGNDIDEVVIPSTVTDNICSSFAFDTGVNVSQNDSTITCGCFSIYDYDSTSVGIKDYDIRCSKDVVIPSEIDGKTVVQIGFQAFYLKGINSVVLPDTITKIGDSAFCGNNISSLNIPNSVTKIDMSAFKSNKITSLEIPNSVTEISFHAFEGNRISYLKLPNTIRIIDTDAFLNNQLETLVIPNGNITIGNYAFYGNPLVNLTILGNNVSFLDNTFNLSNIEYLYTDARNSSSLKVYSNVDTLVIGEHVEEFPIISSSITVDTLDIRSTSIVERDYVTTYGNNTNSFATDRKFTNVIIGDNITSIGNNAFYRAEIYNVDLGNSIVTIGSDAFGFNHISSIEIPDSVTTINSYALFHNNIEEIVFGSNISTIGNGAFSSNSLKEIDLGNHVTSIGNSAFSSNLLEELVIPDSVVSIGNKAFYNNKLISVTIGNGITSIDTNAFEKNRILSDDGLIESNLNLASITINKTCSVIKNMSNYAWIGTSRRTGTTIYGANNEVCDAY